MGSQKESGKRESGKESAKASANANESAKESMIGARILWECLEREGVKTVFGYPGGAILPAYDALQHSSIRHILVRHEQGATHMADGYARATGEVGVAVATSGPGATNMVTGIATAMMDSSPIVCITGQVGSKLLGSRRVSGNGHHRRHAADHEAQLSRDARGRNRAATVREAMYVAKSGRPGPVLIDITKDAQQGTCEFDWEAAAPQMRGYRPDLSPAKDEYDKALKLIREAKRPVILAGHGILDFGRRGMKCRRSRRRTCIPVAMTLLGLGELPGVAPAEPRHDGHARRGVGEQSHSGSRPAARVRHALRRPRDRQPEDLRAEREEDPHRDRPGGDQQERESGRGARRRPARRSCTNCCRESNRSDRREWIAHIGALKGDSAVRDIQKLPDNGHLYAAHVINDLWHETRDRDAIIVTDVGQHQMWEAQYYKHEHPRSLITSGGLGTMGFALPAAIGAKVARPGCGRLGRGRRRRLPDDACAELATIVQENLEGQHRHHQQRLPRDGAPVAGILLRAQLRGHAAAQSEFREAGEAYGIRASVVTAARRRGARPCARRRRTKGRC